MFDFDGEALEGNSTLNILFWYSLIAVKKDGSYQRSNQVPTDMTCKFELYFPLIQLSFS